MSTREANPAELPTLQSSVISTTEKRVRRPKKYEPIIPRVGCYCHPRNRDLKGKGKASAVTGLQKRNSDVVADEFFKSLRRDNKPQKALLRAAMWELCDGAIRLGPQVIYERVERTPCPLWKSRSALVDYKAVLNITSNELIPLTPQRSSSSTEILYPGMVAMTKSPALSWNPSLTDFEEEEFLAESAYLTNVKLAYHLPLETEGKSKIYESHEAQILKPDGSVEMRERVRVILTETPTEFTIRITGKCVDEGTEEYEKVKANNERYERIIQHHLESDAYTDRSTQVFLDRERDKSTQLNGVVVVDAETAVTRYMIIDEFAKLREKEAKRKLKEEEYAVLKQLTEKQKAETRLEDDREDSSDDDLNDDLYKSQVESKVDWAKLEEFEDAEDEEPPIKVNESEIEMSSEDEFDIAVPLDEIYARREERARNQRPKMLPDLNKAWALILRILSSTRYQYRHMDIRGFEPIVKSDIPKHSTFTSMAFSKAASLVQSGPKLTRYWSYIAPVVKGREINCVAVHPTNGNLVAAAYGGTSFVNPPEGMVCIWNLKCINYPEKIYKFQVPATAIAFSVLTPYLLAIGLLDGNLVVYDIRQPSPAPLSSTMKSQDKHFGPIWDLHWLQETEMASTKTINETLLSLSDDGCLFRWNSTKGFDPTVMLKIRRSPMKIPGRREKRAEALISQLSASYTVCFYPDDFTQYLVGTEEGFIHKATTSYSEQYVGTYIGHTGPVYKIEFSPYARDVFISCGGDWCVKIWKEDIPTCLLTVNTGLRTVFDVTWCPTMSAVFVCTSEVHIEVWDISVNTLEPMIQYKPPFSIGLRQVRFWEYMRGLIIGDDDGGITVYALRNFPAQPESIDDQADQLLGALIPGYKKSIDGEDEEEAEPDDEFDFDFNGLLENMNMNEIGAGEKKLSMDAGNSTNNVRRTSQASQGEGDARAASVKPN